MSSFLYYGQLIMGPAGSGKSTYCKVLQEMSQLLGRKMYIINLDPAAETFTYNCDLDIRDLITVDDVMEELKLGPNGALVYCMEYLMENFDWLEEQIQENVRQDDYVLVDCPGQIELYVFYDVVRAVVDKLQRSGWSLCSMYIVDVTLLQDQVKWISGILAAISTMSNIPLPHLTILSKCKIIYQADTMIQYGENLEPNDKLYDQQMEQEDEVLE